MVKVGYNFSERSVAMVTRNRMSGRRNASTLQKYRIVAYFVSRAKLNLIHMTQILSLKVKNPMEDYGKK